MDAIAKGMRAKGSDLDWQAIENDRVVRRKAYCASRMDGALQV